MPKADPARIVLERAGLMSWFAVRCGVEIAILLLTVHVEGKAANSGVCDSRYPLRYLRLECVVVSGEEAGEEGCYPEVEYGHSVDWCDWTLPCQVWVGMTLEITCAEPSRDGDGELILFRGNDTFGGPNFNWSSADASVAGNYECRWDHNGSLFANRSITVKGA